MTRDEIKQAVEAMLNGEKTPLSPSLDSVMHTQVKFSLRLDETMLLVGLATIGLDAVKGDSVNEMTLSTREFLQSGPPDMLLRTQTKIFGINTVVGELLDRNGLLP